MRRKLLAILMVLAMALAACKPDNKPKPVYPTLEPSTWAAMEAHAKEWSNK